VPDRQREINALAGIDSGVVSGPTAHGEAAFDSESDVEGAAVAEAVKKD